MGTCRLERTRRRADRTPKPETRNPNPCGSPAVSPSSFIYPFFPSSREGSGYRRRGSQMTSKSDHRAYVAHRSRVTFSLFRLDRTIRLNHSFALEDYTAIRSTHAMLHKTPTGTWLPAYVPDNTARLSALLLIVAMVQSATGLYLLSLPIGLKMT